MAYTEKQRAIFGPYHDGVQERMGDPSRIYRRMVRGCGGDPAPLFASVNDPNTPEPLKFEQIEQILKAAEFAFELHMFDPSSGAGVTEDAALSIVKAFNEFIEKKNATPPNSATCSRPMEGEPDLSISGIGLDSGSTANVSS